jgi:tetratricopeptide (TPR) repeat protein
MGDKPQDSLKVRREPRFSVGWTVRVQTKGVDEVHTLQTVNLSRSGAFICTPRQAPNGTLLQLTFAVPEEGEFVVFGEVVRVVDSEEADARQVEAGMGVAFMNPRKTIREVLDRILRSIESRVDDDPLDGAASTWTGLDAAAAQLKANAVPDPKPEFDPESHFKRARSLHELGDFAGALEIAKGLIERIPGETRYRVLFHVANARVLLDQQENDKAVIHWEAVVKLDPTHSEAVAALREAGVSKKQQESLVSKLFGRLRGS